MKSGNSILPEKTVVYDNLRKLETGGPEQGDRWGVPVLGSGYLGVLGCVASNAPKK